MKKKRFVIHYNREYQWWEVIDKYFPSGFEGTRRVIIEGGYTKIGALTAASFHNWKVLGPGSWKR